ncbi:hypothetical protein B0I35DRAFT_479090 [Stachybotrys elegans]|uniref:Uncharacterized protein n=1 Tax=Stachybotrys elegans TaxID=80388 RepID=A0A8K0SVJ8_9HYPO|nr:hypothetical protein B0I35DRAFT_479090 [Stachybotrys elegans]
MGDTLDIHDILQTGYFTTSRAKNSNQRSPPHSPSSPSRTFPPQYTEHGYEARDRRHDAYPALPPLPRRSYPPAPTCEDEADSIAREHGVPLASTSLDDEPQSRGEVDQNPIMVEVHEFNPERRFVLVENTNVATENSPPEITETNKRPEEREEPTGAGPSIDRKEPDPRARLDEPKPQLRQRKSRQDLPRLETGVEENNADKHHYRTTSASATGPSRSDNFSSASSRMPGEDLLTPQVIKPSNGRRERAYYGYPATAGPPRSSTSQRSQSAVNSDRRFDDHFGPRGPRGLSPPKTKRASSNLDSENSRRQIPEDRPAGPRPLEESPRVSRRDPIVQSERGEASRPVNGDLQDSPSLAHRRRKSIVVQEGNPVPGYSRAGDDPKTLRSQSRVSTIPLPGPSSTGFADGPSRSPRASMTFPLPNDEAKARESPKVPLPYPEDDPFLWPQIPVPSSGENSPRSRSVAPQVPPAVPAHVVPVSMPIPMIPERSMASETYSSSYTDPIKPALAQDLPVGTYRRSSESMDKSQRLPECPRVKPVAGKMDWLTLPRTDFNICPDCYESVFAHTTFRNEFQPMLRPSDKEISCDFGSSPWYRIAWLLTLRNKSPSLRLFYRVADLMATTKKEPCPGPRRATRSWMTVRDPFTRKPVPGFTICYQCANMVVALLPNLNGAFVPASSRGETTRGMCALHFTPERQRFTLYFDAIEMASMNSADVNRPAKVEDLAKSLTALSVSDGCREDNPVVNGYWHVMQYLPEFTVCEECFEEVVRPRLENDDNIARNFYTQPRRVPEATCQLYSERMRDIFRRACRRDDPIYLEDKVKERLKVEASIHADLLRLDKGGRDREWTKEQVKKLIEEWQKWE